MRREAEEDWGADHAIVRTALCCGSNALRLSKPGALSGIPDLAGWSGVGRLGKMIPRGKYARRLIGDPPKCVAEHFIRCPACGGWIDLP
jgi:hypothetical protein